MIACELREVNVTQVWIKRGKGLKLAWQHRERTSGDYQEKIWNFSVKGLFHSHNKTLCRIHGLIDTVIFRWASISIK